MLNLQQSSKGVLEPHTVMLCADQISPRPQSPDHMIHLLKTRVQSYIPTKQAGHRAQQNLTRADIKRVGIPVD